ncbi:MAG: cytochrome o ubiquinol oxidase subunit IV [Patescibacteria group bacterium]
MNQAQFNKTLTRYAVGFATALALSVLAFLTVTNDWIGSPKATMAVLLALASVQLVVQLVCFLHLSLHGRARGRAMTLGFTIVMMLIIVIGSVWIMNNLDYQMGMSGEAMNEYMKAQNEKGF